MPGRRQPSTDPDPASQAEPEAIGDFASGAANFTVVGLGASAGGLDALSALLDSLDADLDAAFVIVQHLDPTHPSLMAELLAEHTAMPVAQATDGARIQPRHVYIIPPGAYLAVAGDVLRLSQPQAKHGARLPFDFLLRSLAEAYGPRAVCVVLSGSGADGSLGLMAVREQAGLIIAQDPAEAAYDGMPKSAIATGGVDLVLPIAKIGAAIAQFGRHLAESVAPMPDASAAEDVPAPVPEWAPKIVDLLRRKTAHDFTLYKGGTVQRRIERRMAIAGIGPGDGGKYLDMLNANQAELDLLAKDLLINVTRFFRDTNVFEGLAQTTVPQMLRDHPPGESVRVWVVGCSTGEEAYSIAMLLREAITASESDLKLQIFASDVDADAVAIARDGLYPDSVAADVSPERLERFFSQEDRGWRVTPDLRSAVVFTVQDVLTDPPFSRIDLITCRNLLIYLTPEAQARAIALFHFALRQGGLLLLGSAETIGEAADRFSVVSKSDRLYRHVARSRPGDLALAAFAMDAMRAPARPGAPPRPTRESVLAELCRRTLIEAFAPAAVLINAKDECLHFLGATDRYLRVPTGSPTHDIVSMSPKGVRGKMRSAIQQTRRLGERQVIGGCSTGDPQSPIHFSLDLRPLDSDGEALILISFVDQPPPTPRRGPPQRGEDVSRIAELEAELDATRSELQNAIHNLELSSEEQKAINEEALSVNEEFQSTNEELLTSKEELQSLNEELTALNSQLQESLERQRTGANDLQNILYSTDLAMLFLDASLNIRFFTPATRSLFNLIATDIGRPLADLAALAPDDEMAKDAQEVLGGAAPVEREIETVAGLVFARRILPYRTLDNGVEGVVITFTDITERKHAALALEAARAKAEQADAAKSRFLAVASHDLRQPLQSLTLIEGLLRRTALDERARVLVSRLEQTSSAMAGMLNTLLDINQIEAGVIRPEPADFRVDDMLGRIREEFALQAQAQKIDLRGVRCSLRVRTDPHLLEQMLRNLVSNALKYTERGRVLIGCRRRGNVLAIEVWDSGIGIGKAELAAIFEEYHQVGNTARDRNRGLGLGLSIVDRLARLLDLGLSVRSWPGKGSVFIIEAPLAREPGPPPPPSAPPSATATPPVAPPAANTGDPATPGDPAEGAAARALAGSILLIEDDPDVGELLELHLKAEGRHVVRVLDGAAAVRVVTQGKIRPDLILTDYNLPGDMDGLMTAAAVREILRRPAPVLVMTGDISIATLRRIADQDCAHVSKPVTPASLQALIAAMLPVGPRAALEPAADLDGRAEATVYVVDDDPALRRDLREILEDRGLIAADYDSCEAFLQAYERRADTCLVIDAYLPGMSGLDLLETLKAAGDPTPAIMITGKSDAPMVVQAMKAGAWDFIEKPIGRDELLSAVGTALEQSRGSLDASAWRAAAARKIADLTDRQRQIMSLVLEGHPSKNIAADLAISQRTVENHRAAIMHRLGAKSLPALARMAMAAADIPAAT
jgi:two-component system CheB/CheR fusion protein